MIGPKTQFTLAACLATAVPHYSVQTHEPFDVTYSELHYVTGAISRNEGVLITPNHFSNADAIVMYRAAEQIGMPFYFMSGW